MIAIIMPNAGGTWDNYKKYIENDGACGGKCTETDKTCVVGDLFFSSLSIASASFAPFLK